jgi:hypothetical protein
MRNAYKIFVGKLEEWEDNVREDLREIRKEELCAMKSVG